MEADKTRSVRIEVESGSLDQPDVDAPNVEAAARPPYWFLLPAAAILAVLLVLAVRPDSSPAAADGDEASEPEDTPALERSVAADQPELPDLSTLIRADGTFFALGAPGEPLGVWRSDDGVSWSQVDIELNGSTSDFGLFSGLTQTNEGLSMVRLAGGGQIIHRLTSPDGIVWTRAERLEIAGGGLGFPLGQTPSAIASIRFGAGIEDPVVSFLREVVADTMVLEGVTACGIDQAEPTGLVFFDCADVEQALSFDKTDLLPGVSMADVSSCALAIENSSNGLPSIVVTGRSMNFNTTIDGIPFLSWAALEQQDVFLVATGRELSELPASVVAERRASCERLSDTSLLPVEQSSPAFTAVDSSGATERYEIPDDVNRGALGGELVAVDWPGDETSILLLIGNYLWRLDLDTGEWTRHFEREPTFTSSGQTLLSVDGDKLVLVGSTMRVGSVSAGEWIDLEEELPFRSTPIYADDELVLLQRQDGTPFTIPMPEFN